MEDKRLKYNENANFGSFIVSGNHNTLGDIRGINYQAVDITGFSRKDLEGQNIDIIVPPLLRPFHDFFMRRYLADKKAKVMNVERGVAVSDKKLFIIPSSLLIKPIPTLQNGIEIIGLLTPNKDLFTDYLDPNSGDFHYIVFSKITGNLIGVSRGCYYEFGIPPYATEGNSKDPSLIVKLNQIFPKLDDCQNLEKMSTSAGESITTLDTVELQKKFFNDNSEVQNIGNPRLKEKAF